MKRPMIWTAAVLAAGCLMGWLAATGYHPAAVAQDTTAKPAEKPAATAEETAVRALVDAFRAAAVAKDPKAAAALWTEHGEFTDTDGSVVRGRAELEKMYAETYTTSPKGKVDVELGSVRPLGKNLASSEGIIRFMPADGGEAEVTKFAALHVREGDHWLIASARESEPEENELVKLSDLDWLIGDWAAKRGDREVLSSYTWGDEKAFIQCRFQVIEKGKVIASGIEMLAKDPTTGQIRAWIFDRSGTLAEASWTPDGKQWVVEMSGTLPDGSELSAVNTVVPINKDSFSWVSAERMIGDQELPNVAPIRINRVKK